MTSEEVRAGLADRTLVAQTVTAAKYVKVLSLEPGDIAHCTELCHWTDWYYPLSTLMLAPERGKYQLATASWDAIEAHRGPYGCYATIRVSEHFPHRVFARGMPYLEEAAPIGCVSSQEHVARLTRIGPVRIDRTLRAFNAFKRCPLVLADNTGDRRTFAAWWEQQTGQRVPEITDLSAFGR